MTTCIKCGKEIPDGELFCAECGLNPGAAPSRPRPSAAAQPGRMQTPVRRTESPKSSEKQPQEPTGKQPAKPEKKEKKANEEENEEKKENVPIGKEAVEGA